MSLLEGKVAIVTGAAQGIGARLAAGLAGHGAKVVLTDIIDGEKCAEDLRQAGRAAIFVQCDVTSESSVAQLAKRAEEEFGGVDTLVNNAALFGTLPLSRFEDIELDVWDQVMRVNVRGVWQITKACAPLMERRNGGSVVNIATNRVFKGFPQLLHYDASKGAVVSMTKALAKELGDRNIRVNSICPGLTMSENVIAKDGIELRNEMVVAGRSLQRAQQPEDLVGAAAFFASDLSNFVTGQSLIVDGGGIMM